MNYEECKEFLYRHYSKNGFNTVVVDNQNTWMLKNKKIDKAYINLTKKDEALRVELFNVEASFDLENFDNIAVIENINDVRKIINIGIDKELINKKNEEETKVSNSVREKNFFITTETSIDIEIEKRITVISVQRIYGINFIKDIFSFIRDIVGGRVGSLEEALSKAHDDILKELKQKALRFGGSAVIGLTIEHTYNNANNGSILSVYATGTVVKLKV